MANTCFNTIHASVETLAALFNDKGEVDFNLIMPSDEPGFAGWGTSQPTSFELSKDKRYLYLETRWSEPSNLVDALAEKFPDDTITFEYDEEGMGFAGKKTYHKGTIKFENRDWYFMQSSCPLCDGYGIDEALSEDETFMQRTCDECGAVFRYFPNATGTDVKKVQILADSGEWLDFEEADEE